MNPAPPVIPVVPAAPVASPADMVGPAFGPDVPFWRPGWRDTARHLGWRWVLFLPPVLAVAALLALPWEPRAAWWLLTGHLKILAWVIVLPVAAAGTAVRAATGLRTDPFCIHCGYDLTGLPEAGVCPECGRPYTRELIDEYRRDPAWFVQRYRARGTAPAAVGFDAGPVRRKRSRDGT